MARIKRGAMVASILMLVAIITSACNQPYSQQPSVTNTPIDPNSLFATPLSGATQMTDVEIFATGTQAALQTTTPASATPSGGVGITPQASATPTPVINLATNTSTATLAVSGSGPSVTPLPAGARPDRYTLHKEEFPYCIARRYDLDPVQLLSTNQLGLGDIYIPGFVLDLTRVTSRFPGVRALRNHPDTYTVTGNGDTTVYGVACRYGDVEPAQIAAAQNPGISVDSALSVGLQLKIP